MYSSASPNTSDPSDQVLTRSETLLMELGDPFEEYSFEGLDPRSYATLVMHTLSLEHADALRALFDLRIATSATAILRMQFEALVRGMWLMYAASDQQVEKMTASLNLDSEQGAKNLPAISGMLEDLGKHVGTRLPREAYLMLTGFRDVQLKSLNSFVHAGIHPLHRHANGFPVALAIQVLKSSNALATMAFMSLSNLVNDPDIARHINTTVREFRDCLPELLPQPTATPSNA